MDPERWQRIARILGAVWDLPPEERSAFITRETDDDPGLRAELESLLAAEAGAGSFLEHPAEQQLAQHPSFGLEQDLPPGTRIGPWAVGRALGRGGMGVVYLAERADGQFRQRVALKLIKRGMDSAEIVQRFLAERQILAKLVHPHIARLLDGGTAPDGRPWFALEYVEGTPLNRFAADRALSFAARLHLFEQVAEAVRYAHQNLVVHRDLKPSNILVTEAGEAKLLDFGIAKVLHGALETGSTLTSRGEWLLTPEYGAPEQVRGEPITTATDVYSLGAVLYELLSGERAHRLSELTPAEVHRVVCESAPPPPSAVAPAAFRPKLRGDLDTIVLKALAKEPERRYPSAEALLDDLRRHRAGMPVLARPDSALYRARKFVRRHRLGVAASGAIVLALLAGIVATLRESYATRREADRVLKAKAVLVSVLETSVTMQPGQQVIYPRELLDQGVRQVDSAFAAEPSMRQELLADLARINHQLGYLLEADSLLVRALAAARLAFAPDHPTVASRLAELARVREDEGDLVSAAALLRESLAIGRAASPAERAASLDQLALLYGYAGRLAAAESLLRMAPEREPRLSDPKRGEAAARLTSRLADILAASGNWRGADSAWTRVLATRTASGHAPDSLSLVALDGLAGVRERNGDLAEAERLRRLVLTARRAGHDPVELADAAVSLARVLAARGALGDAHFLLTDALAAQQAHLGADHPVSLATASDLALLAWRLGKVEEAAAEMRRLLDTARAALGALDPVTLTLEHNLGGVLEKQGKGAEAAPLLAEALAGRERVFGKGSPEQAQTLKLLGELASSSRTARP